MQLKTKGSTLTCHCNTNMNIIVNSVAWAPHELGPLLACASSDGRVSILSFKGNNHIRSPMVHVCQYTTFFQGSKETNECNTFHTIHR